MSIDFSKEVKAIRKRLGLTQEELANHLGVDKQTVSRWERAERRPSQLAQRQINRLNKKKEGK